MTLSSLRSDTNMANGTDREAFSSTWIWWGVAIVAVLALILFIVPALTGERITNIGQTDDTETGTGAIGGADPTPSIADILENPLALEGNTVTVTGEVERALGARVFVLDEFGIAQDQILVIAPAQEVAFEEGSQVRVTGIVRSSSVAEFEREFSLDLSREFETRIEQRPFIVAQTVSAE
jgi:hypothetical protein